MVRPTEEQFVGCLIGQCLGDALGFVVEGHPPEACRKYVDGFLRAGHAGEVFRSPFPFGQYSDDSQLARELVQSYVRCRKFDPADYARCICAIFAEGRIVGPGGATTAAARLLAEGVSWERSGTPPPAAGNGSAMRAGPIGLFFYDDPERLIRAAHDQGRITHSDRRCSAGAVAIAGAVALSLSERPIQIPSFIEELAAWISTIEESVGNSVLKLRNWIALTPKEASSFISKEGLKSDEADRWDGISPFVTSSVLWSLYSFLRSPENYWETICTAIGVGGDVDTTAAMAGAISGAHLGIGGIPQVMARRLTDRGAWRYTELRELGATCYETKMNTRT